MTFKHFLSGLVFLGVCSFHVSATQDDAEQQLARGGEYFLAKNYDQAQHWFKLAAEKGNSFAQFMLGYLYTAGLGVRQDYAQAHHWYEQAAAQGLQEAQYSLGFLYHHGQGVRQDYVQARHWYELAAAQGHAKAQYNLGVLYRYGQGVRQNTSTAKQWFGKSCDGGNQLGCDGYRELNELGL